MCIEDLSNSAFGLNKENFRQHGDVAITSVDGCLVSSNNNTTNSQRDHSESEGDTDASDSIEKQETSGSVYIGKHSLLWLPCWF